MQDIYEQLAGSDLGHWLAPFERDHIIRQFVRHDIVVCDNARRLPLKSGGNTDVYVNMRNLRNFPELHAEIAGYYAIMLRRLRCQRFAEVPQAVSGLAGIISTLANIPYITIRDQPKIGRVSDAEIIGNHKKREFVPILDDVMTDGGSKIGPINSCLRRHLRTAVVILVDRQQGWETKFRNEGISVPVWSGMTLHDIRRFLVEEQYMERCNPANEERNKIIVALDNMTWKEVLALVDPLRPSGAILKVNDLALLLGFGIIRELSTYGRLMVDIKSHDIPNTMGNTAAKLAPFNPWAATVHASAHKAGMVAFKKALRDGGASTLVLAVTLLTSHNTKTCDEIYHRLPLAQVLELAAIANDAGVDGFVCSPEEARELRRLYPNMKIVTPGVRSDGVGAGDQARVAKPIEAVDNGADFLVCGRQVTQAKDPTAEVVRIHREELRVELAA